MMKGTVLSFAVLAVFGLFFYGCGGEICWECTELDGTVMDYCEETLQADIDTLELDLSPSEVIAQFEAQGEECVEK